MFTKILTQDCQCVTASHKWGYADKPTIDISQKVSKMDLEPVSQKQVNELERLVKELLVAMRKARLQSEPLAENLRLFEQELGDLRRKRFDEANPGSLNY
jgi:hypothetical protein